MTGSRSNATVDAAGSGRPHERARQASQRVDPDGLRFAATRGEPYGVDFTAPIPIGQMNHLHHNVLPEAKDTHSDLLPFLGRDDT
ncbi:hypothetical protein FHS23_000525 [Prauserella isguenensis]|uniref:Uncharacterized protein n=1 Tax=Prauserella isguenensis TaxID=1470180 RepID=A0A839RXG4_9PSEU|nr:hypothetical protein [Prauserella isguenensis]MBB3049530.1 hypothetical protein [Prauserella isguenensis]